MQLVSPILICWIVVYLVDSAIQRFNNQGQINPNPMDSAIIIGFPNSYPLDRGLSSGQCYPCNFWTAGPSTHWIVLSTFWTTRTRCWPSTKCQYSESSNFFCKPNLLQWMCSSFSPASALSSPLLGTCLYTNMWHASDKGSCMSQKHAWSWTRKSFYRS